MIQTRRAFLTRIGWAGAGLGAWSLIPGCATKPSSTAGSHLPRSTPEAEGVSSAGLLAYLEAAAKPPHEMHSFMLVRHGRVVAEGWWSPYAPQFNHTLYSMSKSFTSTAVGLAVAEGRLTVEDKVVSFFPDDLPGTVSDNLAALRVKDLLTMSVGNEREVTLEMVKQENWARVFLAAPVARRPGTSFVYNSGATYMCSAIVQRVTGQKVIDYLRPRLFDPLGIEGMTWETCPRGINVGGWGLSVPTEALARFGQLYLRKGVWNGRALLPAAWVEEATTFKIQQPDPAQPTRPRETNDWLQGYCYQFWRSTHHAYRGDGAFGQYTLVLPEQDAVVAITSESGNMQGQLDAVWQHLLPALHERPLPADRASQTRLQETLDSLALTPLAGTPSGAMRERVSGKTFSLAANDSGFLTASFAVAPYGATWVTLRDAQGEYPICCGVGRWVSGETALPGTPPRLISGGAPPSGTKSRVAASGSWKDDATFEMIWRFYETPHHDTVTCRFEGDTVKISFLSSIAAMSTPPNDKRPVLEGKLAA